MTDSPAEPEFDVAAYAALETQADVLQAIATEYNDCQRCPLHKRRTRVVHGEGSSAADVVVLWSAPDTLSDREGYPLVGAAGQCFTAALARAGAERRDVWLTTVVPCIPRSGRRVVVPDPKYVAACSNRVEREVYTVDPRFILTFGLAGLRCLVGGKNLKMGTGAGKLTRYTMAGNLVPITYPALATWDPVDLLRRKSLEVQGTDVVATDRHGEAWFEHVAYAVNRARIPRAFPPKRSPSRK